MNDQVEHDASKDLACWFGSSYASFLVLPRVLMQDMPVGWQERMAGLLNEYDDAFPNQPDIGTTVRATSNGKLIKMPGWLLNYRHPARDELAKLRDHAGAGRVDAVGRYRRTGRGADPDDPPAA